jgi:hypothetical protein
MIVKNFGTVRKAEKYINKTGTLTQYFIYKLIGVAITDLKKHFNPITVP